MLHELTIEHLRSVPVAKRAETIRDFERQLGVIAMSATPAAAEKRRELQERIDYLRSLGTKRTRQRHESKAAPARAAARPIGQGLQDYWKGFDHGVHTAVEAVKTLTAIPTFWDIGRLIRTRIEEDAARAKRSSKPETKRRR